MNDLKFHKKPIPESFIANDEQRLQKADVIKQIQETDQELLKRKKVIK